MKYLKSKIFKKYIDRGIYLSNHSKNNSIGMNYLKYFKESQSEITLKDKLELIVNMYQYIWSNQVDPDSLGNFTGKCSVLFTGCMQVNKGWNISKKEGRPYEFDVDCLLKKLETDYRKEEKLKNIEELYKSSIITRFKHTKEEIEQFLSPVLNLEITGAKIIKEYKIESYFNSWRKKPCFLIKCKLNDEFLTIDEVDFDRHGSTNRRDFKELEDEFYSYYKLVKIKLSELEINKLECVFNMDNNTHLLDFFNFNIRLEEI